MGNMNVKVRLEKLSNELEAVQKHVAQYSGISREDSRLVDSIATGMAVTAAHIAAEARRAGGNTSGTGLVKRIRKALGFTYP